MGSAMGPDRCTDLQIDMSRCGLSRPFPAWRPNTTRPPVQDDNGVGVGVVEHPVYRCLGAIDAMYRDLADRLQLDRRMRNLSGTPGDAQRGNELTYVRETPVVWRVPPVRVAQSPAAGIHASAFCERRQPPRTFRTVCSTESPEKRIWVGSPYGHHTSARTPATGEWTMTRTRRGQPL
jgi:hypothetical protein